MPGTKVSAVHSAEALGVRGIQRLAGAVLVQAIDDLRCGVSRRREEATRWIESDSDEQFSFVFCCRMLERDPEDTRRFLLRQSIPGWLISSLFDEADGAST
jgi:hypothetical protein